MGIKAITRVSVPAYFKMRAAHAGVIRLAAPVLPARDRRRESPKDGARSAPNEVGARNDVTFLWHTNLESAQNVIGASLRWNTSPPGFLVRCQLNFSAKDAERVPICPTKAASRGKSGGTTARVPQNVPKVERATGC